MVCKNCGKEMEDGAAFCGGCGAKTTEAMSMEINTTTPDSTVTAKKLSKGQVVLICVFAVLIIIVIACAAGGSGGNVIEADNYNGMSFNYGVSEWCERFNDAISKVDEEFETETDIHFTSSLFKLDDNDYDTTDANVVKYYYEGNYMKKDDFAISLYVDSDTEKICKCEVVYAPYTGDDLTMLLCYTIVPSIMATTDTDFDTARSVFIDEVLKSDNYTYYDSNICYQYGAAGSYDYVAVQAVSPEVYDEKY